MKLGRNTKFWASACLDGTPKGESIAARLSSGQSPFAVWLEALDLSPVQGAAALGISQRHMDSVLARKGPYPEASQILGFCYLYGVHPAALAAHGRFHLHPHLTEAIAHVAFRDPEPLEMDRTLAMDALAEEYERFNDLSPRTLDFLTGADYAWSLWQEQPSLRSPQGDRFLAQVFNRPSENGHSEMRIDTLDLYMIQRHRELGARMGSHVDMAEAAGKTMWELGRFLFKKSYAYDSCIEACRRFVERHHGTDRLAKSLSGGLRDDVECSASPQDDLSYLIDQDAPGKTVVLNKTQVLGFGRAIHTFVQSFDLAMQNMRRAELCLRDKREIESRYHDFWQWKQEEGVKTFALPLYASLCALTRGERKEVGNYFFSRQRTRDQERRDTAIFMQEPPPEPRAPSPE